ncbi:putative salt-induced outer membrane protein [Poseidonocella pacifica]|uniref:Putative salt-induced outer membrane protein n=1 Tax=Poseidonocella pacifica TaxID=871651 RepID=A0A1I0WGB5_9RHOB|nr:DUF481 domain-containing protein [Poseidonocella pacifica]SFA87604.1 putative salt-induced outer membrane protein [Poseidonocella pacifica]
MNTKLWLSAASIVALTAGAVSAQSVFTGTDQATDRNEDLRDDIEDDFDRDLDAFGNTGRATGFSGSLAFRSSIASGNTDSADVGLGTDFGYYDGLNGYELQLNYAYAEDDGDTTEESLFYDFEYKRDFGDRWYGFAKVQGTVDEFSAYESDTFVGLGAGYRVISTSEVEWTVQAGPGYRVASFDDFLDEVDDIDEAAFSMSSNYSNRINEQLVLTNDTDIITSESDTAVINELGLNMSMTDTLALRTELNTEYHSEPQSGFDDYDNTWGVSLVYSFN